MRNNKFTAFFLSWAIILSASVLPLFSQEAAQDKLIGVWNVEVLVDTEAFYLTLTMTLTEGKLGGTVTELSGSFSDVPLSEAAFDGTTLTVSFNAPTPPDGLERAIGFELKAVDDTNLEGTVNVPDLGVIGQVKAVKQ